MPTTNEVIRAAKARWGQNVRLRKHPQALVGAEREEAFRRRALMAAQIDAHQLTLKAIGNASERLEAAVFAWLELCPPEVQAAAAAVRERNEVRQALADLRAERNRIDTFTRRYDLGDSSGIYWVVLAQGDTLDEVFAKINERD